MRCLFKSLLLLLLLATVAQADIFRCRDTSGRLVFTDDPARFPPGCKEETAPPPGAVNVVPMPAPAGASKEAEALIRTREERRQAEQQQLAAWRKEAQTIADNFRQAQRQRHYPRIHTQARIKAALEGMAEAAQKKKALLQSMAAAGASQDQVQEVTRLLKGVEAP